MAGKEQGSFRSATRASAPPIVPPGRSASPSSRATEEDLKSELQSVKSELSRARDEIIKLKEQLSKQHVANTERKEVAHKKVFLNSVGGKQQLYANHFKSNFFLVEAQSQIGLKTNTALVAYLNKVNHATLAYSQQIANANKHFPWQEFGGDAMTNFLVVLGELQSQLAQSAATAAHSAQLMGAAIEKLQSENTSIHQRFQAIGEQHKAAVKSVLPLLQTRQQIIEKYAEWQAYNYKKDMTKAWDRKQIVESNLEKFEALQASPQIKAAMTAYESAINPLLGMMEDVEETRLNAMQNCLSDLCECTCIMGPWGGNLTASIGELSTANSIKEFVTKQSFFQVPHVLTWKQDLSADFLMFQKPVTENHIGRKLSISLSNSFRQRKPSLSPSRRPTIESAPYSPSASFLVTDVIECSMMTPVILEAVRDYAGTGTDSDLIFQAGDLIKLLSPLEIDWSHKEVWCTGRDLSSGAHGRFPSSFVTPCKIRE